jgi:cytochrome c oxidase assembly factor 6
MGWFGSSDASQAAPASTETIKEPPGRVKRAQCWDARDGFFKCLDKNNILDSVKEDEKAKTLCGGELQKFEQNCAASWVWSHIPIQSEAVLTSTQVQYFKQRRVAEYDKAQLLKREEELMAQNK